MEIATGNADSGSLLDLEFVQRSTESLFEAAGENANDDEMKKFFSRLQGLEDDLSSKPTPDGRQIKPKPGFCIKTADSTDGSKVFINICQSPDIPSPPYKSENDLIEILQNGKDGGYKIPMSLAEPRPEKDKSGKQCTVYDVIINNDFCTTLESNEVLKSIVMSVVLMGIEDKYKTSLQTESAIVLRNKKYLGNFVKERWVQDRQTTPLITELEKHIKIPKYSLRKNIGASSGKVERIIGEFKLTGITNVHDITLDLGEDRIVLNVNGKYHLDIFLPCDIVQDDARSQFDKENQMLTLTMPVLQENN